jgi:predicted permease
MLRHDLTFALRRLKGSPGFTTAAVLTLALGIGANTTIFSLVNAIAFRPFGVHRQGELVSLNMKTNTTQFPMIGYPEYKTYVERNGAFTGLAAYRFISLNMSRGGENTRLWGYEVSGNYFDLLGVRAARGRVLDPSDDEMREGHPVAVITYGCWQKRFGGDPEIAGKRVKINGLEYTIAGVAPREFVGTELVYTPEVFVPMAMARQIEHVDWQDQWGYANALVIGRLKPGVGMKAAEANLNAIAAQIGRQHPKEDDGVTIALSAAGMAGNFLRGAITGFSAVLMVVSALVLLIACVNIAGLLLARATDRRRETAIRLALGASRGQLIRQLLTESALLSIAGGAAGILMAMWLADLVNVWRPPIDAPVIPPVAVDARVLLFAAASTLATVMLFGLAPALQSTREGLAGAMKNDAPADRLRRFSLRDVLVATQVALSVVLLIGSILVVRSLQHALSLKLGFDPRQAATLSIDMGGQGYGEERGREFQRRLLDKVRAIPGVEAAGMTDGLPLSLSFSSYAILVEGQPVPRAADIRLTNVYRISTGYLQAMHTRLMAGRDFEARDSKETPRVVLVNEAFVKQFLGGSGGVGKRFRYDENGRWYTIAGVVEDGKYRSLSEAPSPTVFESLDQEWMSGQALIVRARFAEAETLRLMRAAVAEIDPSLAVFNEGSVTARLGLALFPARLAAVVLGSFGFLAMVLASTGVYGMMAYAVSRRTREIGIRMALGADPGQVLRVVLMRTAVLLGIGAAAGFGLAFVTGRFFGQILYGVSAHDPVTYLGAAALMGVVAMVACVGPARRAVGVDPLTALRAE